jgi:hypothetical protein
LLVTVVQTGVSIYKATLNFVLVLNFD